MRENLLVVMLMSAFAFGANAAPIKIHVKAGESLVAVRNRIRTLTASDKANGVEVVLAEGEYLLDGGLDLAASDGGVSAAV